MSDLDKPIILEEAYFVITERLYGDDIERSRIEILGENRGSPEEGVSSFMLRRYDYGGKYGKPQTFILSIEARD